MSKKIKYFEDKSDLVNFATSEFNDRFDLMCNDVFLSFLPSNFPPGLDYDQLPFKEPYGLPKGYLFNVFGFPGEFSLTISEGIQVATSAAVFSCMSMLDFLGGVYRGNLKESNIFDSSMSGSKKGSKVAQKNNCIDYAFRFMGYNRQIVSLFFQIYHAKMRQISLADPVYKLTQDYSIQNKGKRVRLADKKRITWEISIGSKKMHLTIKPVDEKPLDKQYLKREIAPPDYRLFFDISKFVEDMINSVFRPKGYLAALEKNTELQQNFDKAIGQLYGF
jgi:hypothetical protein